MYIYKNESTCSEAQGVVEDILQLQFIAIQARQDRLHLVQDLFDEHFQLRLDAPDVQRLRVAPKPRSALDELHQGDLPVAVVQEPLRLLKKTRTKRPLAKALEEAQQVVVFQLLLAEENMK